MQDWFGIENLNDRFVWMEFTGYKGRYDIEIQTFTTQFLSQVDNSPTYDKKWSTTTKDSHVEDMTKMTHIHLHHMQTTLFYFLGYSACVR